MYFLTHVTKLGRELPNMAQTLNVKKQVILSKYFSGIINSLSTGLTSACIAGKIDNVTKNTKKTLYNCGKACLKTLQYGIETLLS